MHPKGVNPRDPIRIYRLLPPVHRLHSREARRLYTAHRLTLYARVALPENTTPSKAAIAAAGQSQQKIASKKVGEVSVTYSSGTSSSSMSTQTDLADLTETSFGLQLLSLLKLYSLTRYVP